MLNVVQRCEACPGSWAYTQSYTQTHTHTHTHTQRAADEETAEQ